MIIEQHRELKPLTWMNVGGKADFFAEVKTKDELLECFHFAKQKDLPIVYLGQGSNLLFFDAGIRGLVIRLINDRVEYKDTDGHAMLVTVEAGKILSRLIHECQKKGLNGFDYFVGIPGSVGAAVRGNIGIPEKEFGTLVKNVEIFDGKKFRMISEKECEFTYRGSSIKDKYWLVWSVTLILKKGSPSKKDEMLLSRILKQPKGYSCGSFFKNPIQKKIFAGKLIEECGLKGKRIGGAFVSEQHGNFLMNNGSAKASDIIELARQIKKDVLAKKGIVLENEVLIYDEFGTEMSI